MNVCKYGTAPSVNPFPLLLNNVMLILVHCGSCPSSSDNDTCFWLGDYSPYAAWSYSAKDQVSEPPPPGSRPNTRSEPVVGPALGLRSRQVRHPLRRRCTGIWERDVPSPSPESEQTRQRERGPFRRMKSANAGGRGGVPWETQLRGWAQGPETALLFLHFRSCCRCSGSILSL